MPKALDLLRAARKLIENPSNWIKGKMYGGRPEEMCLVGALHSAGDIVGQFMWPDQNGQMHCPCYLVKPFASRVHEGWCRSDHRRLLTEFNDAQDTKHEHVLAFLDKYIAAQEAKDVDGAANA